MTSDLGVPLRGGRAQHDQSHFPSSAWLPLNSTNVLARSSTSALQEPRDGTPDCTLMFSPA